MKKLVHRTRHIATAFHEIDLRWILFFGRLFILFALHTRAQTLTQVPCVVVASENLY